MFHKKKYMYIVYYQWREKEYQENVIREKKEYQNDALHVNEYLEENLKENLDVDAFQKNSVGGAA